MKKVFLFLSMIFLIYACQQNASDFEIPENLKIQVSQEEYASIAYDSPRILSEKEALQLVQDFALHQKLSRTSSPDLSINRKFFLEDRKQTRTSDLDPYNIPLYEVSINNNKTQGLAIVAADERVAGVVAYIPQINKDPQKREKQLELNYMFELSKISIRGRIAYIDSLQRTLKDSTILRLSDSFNISPKELKFEDIKEHLEIINTTTRSTPEDNLTNLKKFYVDVLTVDWDQTEPYNLLLPTYPDPDFPDLVTHHYPLGCAVTSLLTIFSYFAPHMEGYDNGEKMVIDWRYLTENRTIINPDYGIPGDPEYRLRMISRVAFWIYNGTKTTSKREANGMYSSSTKDSEIDEELTLYGIRHDPQKEFNVQSTSDFDNLFEDIMSYRVILMGGRRLNGGPTSPTSTGNHTWLIDGYAVTSDGIQERSYVHANMGWGGSYNGWYYIAPSNVSFDTGNGNYNTNFWTISKLRNR